MEVALRARVKSCIISIFLFPYSVAIHPSGVKIVETGKVSALPSYIPVEEPDYLKSQ